ncbi:MAG: hypothetical protein IJS53_02275 [Clostridia bacterium]|nr:hypothetical protein [Clostridia bacterium]
MNMHKKILALLMALLFVLTLCGAALATDASGGDSAGDSAGDSSGAPADAGDSSGESAGASAGGTMGGQEFGTYEEDAASAGIVVENGEVRFAEGWSGEYAGEITAGGITGATIHAAEANGVAIALAKETDTFVIENSDISAAAGQKNNDLGYEGAFGVAVAVKTGELWIRNSRISSEGPRSTPLYMHSTMNPSGTSLVVIDSEITSHTDKAELWMPPFKLLAGGSRATLLMTRNNSWFINSKVTSANWGAISQDTVDAITYVVNSTGMTTGGGYGTYLTNGMYLYASRLYGAQYGAFLCGDCYIYTGTAQDAASDAAALSKTPDYAPEDQPTEIVGAFNAVAVHNALPGTSAVAIGNFKGALLSTMPEDLPEEVTPMAANDDFFMQDGVSFGVESGSAYFFNKNLYGSLILVRSMHGDFTFDNTAARSSSGVLVQTVLTFDPPSASGYLSVGQGETLPGVKVAFLNGEYEGDILHQDYQRRMFVTVGENATLRGAVVSGTWQAWNDLWSEETLLGVLTADGYETVPFSTENWAADVQENLIQSGDTAYAATENLGAEVTVKAGGAWIVTGDSTLSSLTIEEGASVVAPEGMTLTVLVNADASNANAAYTGGTPVDALAAGTYRNVILTVSAD